MLVIKADFIFALALLLLADKGSFTTGLLAVNGSLTTGVFVDKGSFTAGTFAVF
jgi:hypothetical protein